MIDTFTWWGLELEYLDHEYNATRTNERAIEIPIAQAFIDAYGGRGDGLEVGNVLDHYSGAPTRIVVDRDEEADGVLNVAIEDYEPDDRFQWIVSLSTLEHTDDPLWSLNHLRHMLQPGGSMLVTIPMGQASLEVDLALLTNAVGATRCCTMVREWDDPQLWRQTPEPTWLPCHLLAPKGASSVWVGQWWPR